MGKDSLWAGAWWQLDLNGDALIGLVCLAVGALIVLPTLRTLRIEREAARRLAAVHAEAEAERDAYAAMLDSIIDNSQSAIYVKDLEGRYLMANPPLAEILGQPEDMIIGKTDADLDEDSAPSRRVNDKRAETGAYRLEEWNDNFPDGRHFYDSVKFPLHRPNGELYGVCGVSLDITDRKTAVTEISHARDSALALAKAKSAFLATMSHEIRTPLNAVIGMADLLMDTDLDQQQRELLDTVRTSGDALIVVINDILDFSKIESGQLHMESSPFNLRAEIEGCLDLVAARATEKGLELICHIDESCPIGVVGDKGRLRQILVNLLSNAVKFTARGEVLTVATATTTEAGQAQVQLRVKDTGVGIPEDSLTRLFESFSQVDASTTRVYGGTGLGLAISQRLAQALGGEITVVSEPGVGSTFTATLRLDVSSEPFEGVDGEPAHRVLDGRSVLIVDDNPTNLQIVDMQLGGAGMVCTAAQSPLAALAIVADGLHYDVAVIDMHMPEMDGVQLATRLRRTPRHSKTPLVLLTSLGWRPDDPEDAFAAFLTKPVKRLELRDTVAAVLSGLQPSGTPGGSSESLLTPLSDATPLRILLAEDNPVNQRVAELLLRKFGQSVDIVENGLDAVRAVQSSAYDVVLMDVQMPQLDGLEATRAIRADPRCHQPHVVAMTAGAQLEDRAACAAAGMDSYLAKPVRAQELRSLLAQVLISAMRAPEHEKIASPDTASEPTDTDSGGDGSPLDLAVLRELGDDLDDTDGDLRGDIIDSYLADAGSSIPALVEAGVTGDGATVMAIAHRLKSTSALVGARALASLLAEVEQAARHGSENCQGIVKSAAGEYAKVEAGLRRLRDDVSIELAR